jgi:uncharacterized membrane protein YhaH (DUF805 family)
MHWAQLIWPRGRTNRAPYWITFVGMNLFFTAFDKMTSGRGAGVTFVMIGVLSIYVGLSLFIGRLHDLDRSGWWAVPVYGALAPIIVFFVTPLLLAQSLKGWEQTPLGVVAPLLICVSLAVGVLLWTCFKRGTVGPNRFGPDPLQQ